MEAKIEMQDKKNKMKLLSLHSDLPDKLNRAETWIHTDT